VTGLFDDLIGNAAANPRVAEGLVRKVVGRLQRQIDSGALPTGGIYGEIAAVQDTAAERMELARRINDALAAGDRVRASRLIRTGGDLFGLAAMAAAVEAQACEGRLAALQAAHRDVAQSNGEADRWPDPENSDMGITHAWSDHETGSLDQEDRQRRTLAEFEDPGDLVRAWRDSNLSWDRAAFGPPPDEPGCLISDDIIEETGW
jgi:hypothetical protein